MKVAAKTSVDEGPRERTAMDRRQALLAAVAAGVAGLAACASPARRAPASRAASARSTPTLRGTSAPSPTHLENTRRGDRRWRVDRLGAPDEIVGWASRASVVPGEPLTLHISTTAAAYRITAYRTGWYGGTQARQVWRSATLRGRLGAPAQILAPTNTAVTDWPAAITVDTTGWVPGFYMFRLDANSGGQRYIPLAVRSGSASGKVVLLNGDTTWQAYNPYGGYSLYAGPDGAYADRARAVSFDRPYGGRSTQGDGEFMVNLLPLVSVAERLGLDCEYLSDTDLHASPDAVMDARAVVSPGHDEYYSTAMRQRLQAARDTGTNLAFLGANAVYRHIRLGPTAIGPNRLQTCYKDPAEDPLYGRNNADVTGQWRYPPNARPESVLTGVFYESNPVQADMVIVNPHNWLFAGSGATAGMRLPGLVGGEYDRVNLGVPTPRPIEVLARSPLICHGVTSHADMAYYTTPSGAGVLATGTNWWITSLSGTRGPVCQHVVDAVTSTMLIAFARGPAGHSHPAHDNLTSL